MMIRMAIADSNSIYIERLANGLEVYDEIHLSVYTEQKSLKNGLQTKQFDVLLFDPSLYDEQIAITKPALVAMLLEETCDVPESCKGFLKLQKYQRISQIYKKVLEMYADVCGKVDFISQSERMKIFAFYSPVGGCGKTTLSLATAAKLAMQGYETFYMNLEDVASEDCYLPQSAEKGMSELLACLGTETNFSVKLQSLLQNKSEHFYYLNHFATPNDLYELKVDEIEELLNAIGNTGLFDMMIIDMGISLDQKTVRIFECADKIILPERPDVIAAHKMNCFFSQIHIMNEYADKMLRVLNFGIGKGSTVRVGVPIVETVDMLQNPDAAQFIAMLADHGVYRLAAALLN